VFVLALGLLFDSDLLGWVTGPRTWLEIGKSVRQVSPAYAQVDALLWLLATYAFVLALMTAAAAMLGMSIPKFIARLRSSSVSPPRSCGPDLPQWMLAGPSAY
jgi:hypothetical protein